jgi:argininosuccinate synthase
MAKKRGSKNKNKAQSQSQPQSQPQAQAQTQSQPQTQAQSQSKGKVMLAYSGGLDTSCILAWLIEEGYEVLAYMANVGQEEDFNAAREKALKIGASKVFIEDLRQEFVEEFIYPAVQANCIYENVYLLGTSLARPVIARRQIQLAKQEKCTHVAHGCTGKGNDQVRFELAYYALQPDIKVIAPWRIPKFYERFQGRADLLAYAAAKNIPVSQTPAKPWSTDENLFHISYEAGILEDPNVTPPADMWKLTVDPEKAPDTPERITITFEKGIPVKVENHNEKKVVTGALDIFIYLNTLARRHGIGRIDIVENRFIGIKSRGCYETPGGTILRVAHMDLEGLTLDREVRAKRDQYLTIEFSRLLYNGLYFSPERVYITSAIEASQATVNGEVRLKLYKGNTIVEGRSSKTERLYDMEESTRLGRFYSCAEYSFEEMGSECD